MIRKRMSPNGVLVTQSSSPYFTRKTFWCIQQTLDHVFDDTLSYHVTIPSFGIWGFNIASANNNVPRDYKFTIPTQFINDTTMQAAMVFSKDTEKLEVPVNSIMEPRLYQLYIDDLKI